MSAHMSNSPENESATAYETIGRFLIPADAHILRSRLELEGILAITTGDDANRLMPITFGAVEVQVPAGQVSQANEIMRALQAGEFALPDEEPLEQERKLPSVDETLLCYAQDPYYLNAWRSLIDGKGGMAGFNLCAAVFGMPWCFFRRMYATGIVVLAAEALIMFLLALLLGPTQHAAAPSAVALMWGYMLMVIVLVRIPIGMLANILYYRKATGAVRKFDASGLAREQLLQQLKNRGGISMVGGLLGVAITFAYRTL